ncbi:MAG: hypothetical protein RLP14_10315 [Owenweeksia sp.]
MAKSKNHDTGVLSGVGNSFIHQVIIAQITAGLMRKTQTTGKYQNYIATPETSVAKINRTTPDILVWKNWRNNSKRVLVCAIELCWVNKVEDDKQKLIKLMENTESLEEAFVIQMFPLTFHRIYRKKDGKPSKPVKSSRLELFKVDLSKLLDLP